MVGETYVEHLVQRKSSWLMQFLKVLLIMLTVCFIVIGIVYIVTLLLAIACGVGAYFAVLHSTVEYEYLYLDKELDIDRILGKRKRKRVGHYNLERLEIFAPMNSWHLDAVKNRTFSKTYDYSSGIVNQPDTRYVMVCEDEKLILESVPELVQAVQMIAPRKVFTD